MIGTIPILPPLLRCLPTQAITDSIPSEAVYIHSNIVGVRKWSVDAEKRFETSM